MAKSIRYCIGTVSMLAFSLPSLTLPAFSRTGPAFSGAGHAFSRAELLCSCSKCLKNTLGGARLFSRFAASKATFSGFLLAHAQPADKRQHVHGAKQIPEGNFSFLHWDSQYASPVSAGFDSAQPADKRQHVHGAKQMPEGNFSFLHWDSQYASAVSAGWDNQRSAQPQDTFTVHSRCQKGTLQSPKHES
ncbi:MAG: hypothetical protein JPMHGGIA_01990 [Saprospiraceae bacterium]|jgi:hypothetical protein|nr:hypothetical protein [Saprospiraceae bacterium]